VRRPSIAHALAFIAMVAATPACPQTVPVSEALDALVAAYPDALARHDGGTLYWRDGTVMPAADGVGDKPFQRLLREPSIVDQFRLPYPRGPLATPPTLDADPGRFRNIAFFKKMYGSCDKGDVSARLVPIVWVPNAWGKTVRITSVNRVDERLRAVSAEIDALPDKIKHAAYPIAGTYNCRVVADTGQLSPHAFGIAIDLNTAISDYWYRGPRGGAITYKNRIPNEIVEIFEKHGFIWGGKWYHFDTMHFEYRPELLGMGTH
jgi:hypothetical protein